MLLTRVVLLFQSIASCHFATWNLAVVILFFDSTTSWNTPTIIFECGKVRLVDLEFSTGGLWQSFQNVFWRYRHILLLMSVVSPARQQLHKLHTDGLTKQQPYKFYWQPPTKILFTAVQRLMHVPVFSWASVTHIVEHAWLSVPK